eukprot:513380-Hanusia_phi.AAC.1
MSPRLGIPPYSAGPAGPSRAGGSLLLTWHGFNASTPGRPVRTRPAAPARGPASRASRTVTVTAAGAASESDRTP